MRAEDSGKRKRSYLERVAERTIVFRVFGLKQDILPEIRLRHLVCLYASKEVLTLLLITGLILGGIPTLLWLFYAPPLVWMTLPIGFIPIFVTFMSLGLMSLKVAVIELMGRREHAIVVSSFFPTFLATLLAIVGFFLLLEFSQSGSFNALIADSADDLVPWALVALIYAAIAELVTKVVVQYILPRGSDRFVELGRKSMPRPSAPTNEEISIGDERVAISRLVLIEAQGNYVRLVTKDGEITQRTTFSKVLKTLPAELGVQTHRSRWVSYSGIKAVKIEGDTRLVILTTTGASLAVTQSRVEEVSESLRANQVLSENEKLG